MFEAELKNTETEKNITVEGLGSLKKVVEALSDIVEQMEIKCSDKGLRIQVMDSMHVALADVLFSSTMFSSYRCDRDIQLGISTKNFLAVLRNINLEEGSQIRFSCEDTPQALRVEHILPGFQYEFDITLYLISSENYTITDIQYESDICLKSEQFRSILKSMGSFGEYFNFECGDDTLILKQNGDLIKNKVTLKSSEDKDIKITSHEQVILEIAAKYVGLVNKVSVLGEKVNVRLSNGSPVFFEVDIGKVGNIKLYVMPRAN